MKDNLLPIFSTLLGLAGATFLFWFIASTEKYYEWQTTVRVINREYPKTDYSFSLYDQGDSLFYYRIRSRQRILHSHYEASKDSAKKVRKYSRFFSSVRYFVPESTFTNYDTMIVKFKNSMVIPVGVGITNIDIQYPCSTETIQLQVGKLNNRLIVRRVNANDR